MKKHSELIFENFNRPLSSIPFHFDVDGIERYFSEGFPAHLAIHRVDMRDSNKEEYTIPHFHEDEDEINILIPDEGDELVYKIQLGEEIFTVNGSKSIWIPSGLTHGANVVSGSGYFVAIRVKTTGSGNIPKSFSTNELMESDPNKD